MKKPKFSFIVLMMGLGLVAGYLIVPFVHELGHYTFACAYNCSAIKEFVYAPQVGLTQLVPTGNFSGYAVNYVAPIPVVFGSYGILVYLGGFIFELSLFAFIVALLVRYGKKLDRKTLRIYLFLMGFYVIFINSSFTWFYDFAALLHFYANLDAFWISVVLYSIFGAVYIAWAYFLNRFIRNFTKVFPKRRRKATRHDARGWI